MTFFVGLRWNIYFENDKRTRRHATFPHAVNRVKTLPHISIKRPQILPRYLTSLLSLKFPFLFWVDHPVLLRLKLTHDRKWWVSVPLFLQICYLLMLFTAFSSNACLIWFRLSSSSNCLSFFYFGKLFCTE